ncbi:MAG TPA: hypothetical protein VF746_23695 [Longimicrobium sp.]
MGLRQWMRQQIRERADGDELPGGASFLYSALGDKDEAPHALGEFTAETYPADLAGLLRRREAVTAELMRLDLASRAGRREAIPRLQELLRQYPHPLAYEALIVAYVDEGRWDEARGAAFAARERRTECEHSPWPEIRGECGSLKAWAPEEIDLMRAEREGRIVVPGVTPVLETAPAPAEVQVSLA